MRVVGRAIKWPGIGGDVDQDTMVVLACTGILAFGMFPVWAAHRQEIRDKTRTNEDGSHATALQRPTRTLGPGLGRRAP